MAASAVATARARVATPPVTEPAPHKPAPSSKAAASDAAIGAQVSSEGPAEARIRARVREAHEPSGDAIARDRDTGDEHIARAAKQRPEAKEVGGTDAPSKRDRDVTKLADRSDRLFTQLVRQRDLIRRAVEFGDTAAATQAFARARELFSELVAIGNEAQLDVSSSTDSDALVDAKERIAHRVRYAYEWAALIEDAMPGDHTL